MIRDGILNPAINDLISRVRHTNTLVIADRGFPFWTMIETIDISLVDDIPTVLDVLHALQQQCVFGQIRMAEEFKQHNSASKQAAFRHAIGSIPMEYLPHDVFKQHVPSAIGLIRTGDTTPYANMILESA
ncbi:MAG: D-ribose pyranase [Rhodothermales bacterium]